MWAALRDEEDRVGLSGRASPSVRRCIQPLSSVILEVRVGIPRVMEEAPCMLPTTTSRQAWNVLVVVLVHPVAAVRVLQFEIGSMNSRTVDRWPL